MSLHTGADGASQPNHANVHLTAKEISACREQLTDLIIAPFDEAKAKGIGYNLALSEMIYSITRNRLVPICREAQETFFYLRPHETILALSHEYIKVTDKIAGSFHSRVRMTAQGVGSTSTTLDPGWKGMLLFSLNNPTRKKIKILISTRVDGASKTNAVVTLVACRTAGDNAAQAPADQLPLHLDNPPMRIDIWSELTAKPLRLFHNRDYQHFCRLVESLSPFASQPSQEIWWLDDVSSLLTQLRVAIDAQQSEAEIRAALIRMEDIHDLPHDVQKRLHKLTAALHQDVDILNFCRQPAYQSAIQLADREVQYQLLCDQVAQIHARISAQVPISWHKNKFANFFHRILKNAALIAATLVSVVLVLRYVNEPDFWFAFAASLLPLIISGTFQIYIARK